FRDFNDTTFSLNTDDNLKRALAAAQQLPMMASRRVIRITDVRISASGYRDTVTEDDEPLILAYLADPSPHSVVIFIADELNGVRKMGKLLREQTAAVSFDPMSGADLADWARKRFREVGAEIEDRTLNFLLNRTGSDVQHVNNEIN